MSSMDRIIRSIARWWRKAHPDRTLERAIPDYARAAKIERQALARGCTRDLGRARRAKAAAVHRALSGAANDGIGRDICPLTGGLV